MPGTHTPPSLGALPTRHQPKKNKQVQSQNLMILQRKDEAVSEILATATYVVIYVFEPKGKQWERKEVRVCRGRGRGCGVPFLQPRRARLDRSPLI